MKWNLDGKDIHANGMYKLNNNTYKAPSCQY